MNISLSSIERCAQDIYHELSLHDEDSSLEDIYDKLDDLAPEDLLGLNIALSPLSLLFNVSNILLRR